MVGTPSTQTGRHYINTLAAVYAYAKDLGFVDESPIPEFREQINRKQPHEAGACRGSAGQAYPPDRATRGTHPARGGGRR